MKPINLRANEVRALLDTGRCEYVRVAPSYQFHSDAEAYGHGVDTAWDCQRRKWIVGDTYTYEAEQRTLGRTPNESSGAFIEHYPQVCPYGVPGDLLWARETFYYDCTPWALGGSLREQPQDFDPLALYYRADGECCNQIPECQCGGDGGNNTRWRASTQMTRWASRLTVRNAAVRAEKRGGAWCWVVTLETVPSAEVTT